RSAQQIIGGKPGHLMFTLIGKLDAQIRFSRNDRLPKRGVLLQVLGHFRGATSITLDQMAGSLRAESMAGLERDVGRPRKGTPAYRWRTVQPKVACSSG